MHSSVQKRSSKRILSILLCITLLMANIQIPFALADESGVPFAGFNSENMNLTPANWSTISAAVGGGQIAMVGSDSHASYYINISSIGDSVDVGTLHISFSVQATIGSEATEELDTAKAVISFRASEGGGDLSSVTLSRGTDNPGDASALSSNAVIPSGTRFIFVDLQGVQAGAANTVIFTSPSLSIRDNADPTLAPSYNSAWTNQDVVVTLDAADTQSGIEGIYDADTFSKLTGNTQYQYTLTQNEIKRFYAADYSGRSTEVLTVDVQNIDKNAPAQPPEITLDTASWSKVPVSFTLGEVSPAAGESPETKQYKLNAGEWAAYSGQVQVSDEGQMTVTSRVVDDAGNASSETSKTISIDATSPEISSLSAAADESGSATITFNASDALSGVAETRWASGSQTADYFVSGGTVPSGNSFLVSSGGTYTVFAKDNAGNTAVSTITIDTFPVLDAISNQTMQEDDVKQIIFSVSDHETAAGSILVSAVSSNTAILPHPAIVNNNGNVTLTLAPALNKSGGPVSVTVTIEDNTGNTASREFTVTITSVNDLPISVNDAATTNEDTAKSILVLANDTDADGNTLTISTLGSASHGTVVKAGDSKSVTYTPNANFNGDDSFTYRATDGTGEGNLATVTVHVSEVNDLPKANNDTKSTNEDEPVLIDVLANDTDADLGTAAGETLSIKTVGTPSHGSAAIQSGQILYTPNANWSGSDSFTYTIEDKALAISTATVSITAKAVNDAPAFASLLDDYTMLEDGIGYEIQFQITDTETNNASLMLQGASLDEDILAQSGLAITGLGDGNPNVSVFFTPKANANGTVQVSLKVGDGFLVTEKVINLHVTPVNDLPQAKPDNFAYTEDDNSLVIDMDSLTQNDTDIDGDTLFFAGLTGDLTHGTLQVESAADHTYRYIPESNYDGTATFSYTVGDGTAEDTGVVTLSCNAVNDPPVITLDPDNVYVTNEDVPLAGLLFAISDLETSFDDLIITAGSSSPEVVSVGGILAEKVENGECTLNITPEANANGAADITVTVSDGLYYVNETFHLTVNPQPDAPTAIDDEIYTEEGGTVSLPPMANDFDVDNDAITLLSFTQPDGGKGTVTRSGDTLIYKAPAGFSGLTFFTYVISDGTQSTTGTVNVVVGPYAHPPVLSGIVNQFINEDQATSDLPFSATDVDAGDEVTLTITSSNTALVPNEIANLVLTDLGNGSYTLKIIPLSDTAGTTVITVTAKDKMDNTVIKTFTVTVYPQNDLPNAADDTVTTNEDQFVTFNVLDNDSDLETPHVNLKIIGFTSPSHGYLSGASGSYTYTSYANYHGADSFTYTMTDGQATATATVSLTVNTVNDAPYVYSIWRELPNDTGSETTTVNVLSSAHDVDGDTLYTNDAIVTPPRHGTAIVNGDGTITYTRTEVSPEGNGADSFQFRVRDRITETGDVLYGTATVYIGVEFLPSLWIGDVTVTAQEDDPAFWINLNVSNPNGNSLDISTDTPVLGSIEQIDADNRRILYKPNPDANGWESFDYTVADNTLSQVRTATIYVYIYPVNDLPIFTQTPDDVTTAEDTPIGLLTAAFEDVETADLIFTAYAVNTDAQHPVLLDEGIAIERNGNTASLTLSPVANANGSVQVVLLASDGLGSVTESFTLTVTPVNDPPVAEDQAVTLREDTSIDITVLTPNTDVEGDTIAVTIPEGQGPAHGTAVPQPDGTIVYTPNADYFGLDSFTFMLDDGNGGTDMAVISATITNVNDLPVLSGLNYSNETLEDTPAELPFTVQDADNDPITFEISWTNPGLFPEDSITITSSDEDYELKAVPALNAFGAATVTLTAKDGTGETVQTLVITVFSVNDLPIAGDDAYTVLEDTPKVLSVLDNDSDVEDVSLRIVAVGATVNGGKVVNNNGTLTYQPAANYYGPDSFTYTVSDTNNGKTVASVTIDVTSVNDSPNASNDSALTQEDVPVTINVLGNDSDVENDTLTVLSTSASAQGATIVINPDNTIDFTPAPNANGTDTFTYTVSDGQLENSTSTATVTVRITPVNDAPVIYTNALSPEPWEFNEDETGEFVFDVSDVETDAKNLIVTMHSSVPSLIQDTSITLTGVGVQKTISMVPAANASGTTDITVIASDGVKSTTRVFPVTVHPANDQPTITAGDKTTPEDTSVSGQATGTDVEGETLTFSKRAEIGDGPNHGSVTVQADGSYTYTPEANFNGIDSFVILVDDGAGAPNSTNNAVVTITVTPVNDPPVAGDDADTTNEDTAIDIDVLSNDTDIDTDALLNATPGAEGLTLVSGGITGVDHGTAVIAGDKIRFTPQANWNGTETFTYTVRDAANATDTASITVTVTPVDDLPASGNDSISVVEDTLKSLMVLANDDVDITTNPGTEHLSITTIDTQPQYGTANISGDSQSILYTPSANYYGPDSLVYSMTDNDGHTGQFTVTLTVTPVNDVPTISAIASQMLNEDTPSGDLNFNVTDVEDGHGTLTVTYSSSNTTLFPNNNANITFTNLGGSDRKLILTPALNRSGTANITLTVKDSANATQTTVVAVTVSAVNDAPAADDDTATTDENTPIIIDILDNDDVDLHLEGDTLDILTVTDVDATQLGTFEVITDSGREKLLFTPDANWTSTESAVETLEYTMTDAPVSPASSARVAITINPVNDAPVISVISDQTIDEDTPGGTGELAFTVTDEEDDDDTLAVSAESSNKVLFPNANVSVVNPAGGTGAERIVQAISPENLNGAAVITVTVTDSNGVQAQSTFNVTVNPVPDLPTGGDDVFTVTEDTPTLLNVLLNDDVDQDTNPSLEDLDIAQIMTQPSHGTVSITDEKKLLYTPDQDSNADDYLEYRMTDAEGQSATFGVTIHITPVNDAPDIHSTIGQQETDEGIGVGPLSFTVTDVDDDDGILSVTATSNNQTLIPNANITFVNQGGSDRTVSVMPNGKWNGTATITLTVKDDDNLSDAGSIATFKVVVREVNEAPVAHDDLSCEMNEDATGTFTVLSNDSDGDEATNAATETMTIVSTGQVDTGVVNIINSGTELQYIPLVNWNGTEEFTYTIRDTAGATSTATVRVKVTGMNDAPVAAADTDETDEDTPILIDALANDSDVDMNVSLNNDPNANPANESISIVSNGFSGVDGGTVSIQSGKIKYTPTANWNGVDTFTYTITDELDVTSTATVTLTVHPVNDAPDAVNDVRSMNEDGSLTVNVLANDSDVDQSAALNHPVTDTWIAAIDTAPTHGTAVLNGDKTFTYTPDTNWNGVESFIYTLTDSLGASDTATVTITVNQVNDAPVAVDDDVATDEDTQVLISALDNDSDTDQDSLLNAAPGAETITLVAGGFSGVDGGTVSIVGNQIKYVPTPDWNGVDTFTYTIKDGSNAQDTAQVTVHVTPVNDAPVAVDDVKTMNEDASLNITILQNDSDVDQSAALNHPVTDTWAVTLDNLPQHGAVILNGDNTVTYTPDVDWNGTDSFTYIITDSEDGQDEATVTITVNQVNDAPVAEDDTADVDEDDSATIAILANDSDIDRSAALNDDPSETITPTITVLPVHGTAVINGDDTITYTPDANWNGQDEFIYTLTDGSGSQDTALVSITVQARNDAPDAVDDARSMNEDNAITVSILDNDADVDLSAALNHPVTDALTVALGDLPQHGTVVLNGDNTVTYTPDIDWNGVDSFTYIITDSEDGQDEATVTITVNQGNDAPVAEDDTADVNEDDSVKIAILANDSDIDQSAALNDDPSDTFTPSITVLPAHGTAVLNGDDTVTYTPDANWNGQDEFTYTLTDGSGSQDTALVSITVNPVNDSPVALDDSESTDEDIAVNIDVLENDSDVDQNVSLNHPVTDNWSVSLTDLPAHGSAQVESDHTVTYTPASDYNGSDSFTYTVTDSEGTFNTATVSLMVLPVNDAPRPGDDTWETNEDEDALIDALDNDADVDADIALNMAPGADPAGEYLSIDPDGFGGVDHGTVEVFGGKILYHPDVDFNGEDSFTYTVLDASGTGTQTAVTLTIKAVNDPPQAEDDEAFTVEDTAVLVDVLLNDTDVDSDPAKNLDPSYETLSVKAGGFVDVDHGTAAIVDGEVRFTPDENWNGVEIFSYTVRDKAGATDTAYVTVNVDSENNAPKAVKDEATTPEDTLISIDVLANDTDTDLALEGDDLTIVSKDDVDHGRVTIASDKQSLTFEPDENWNGVEEFTYTIGDKGNVYSSAVVKVTVTPVNDAPLAKDDAAETMEDVPKTIAVLTNDVDIDQSFEGDHFIIVSATAPVHGTVTIANDKQTLLYSPVSNWNGNDEFVYTMQDSAGVQSSADVKVKVKAVNDTPAVPTLLTPVASDAFKHTQTIHVTWALSTDAEEDKVLYDLYFYDGSKWERLASKLKDTFFDHTLSNSRFAVFATPYAQYKVEATDGNTTAYDLGDSFIIDSVAPQNVTAHLSAGGVKVQDKVWVNKDVEFSLTGGQDLLPFAYEYRLSSKNGWTKLVEGEKLTFKENGTYVIEYRAVDKLENIYYGASEIRIDKLVPAAKPVVEMTSKVDPEKGVSIMLEIGDDPGFSGNRSVILPDGTTVKASDPIELHVEKNGIYRFIVEDRAGNQLQLPVSVGLPELANDSWLEPKDGTDKITFGRFMPVIRPQFPQGESIDNSAYTEWIKETFNIDLDAAWLVDSDDLDKKIDECMETGEFPDIFMVSDRVQLEKLIKAGMLANLTDAVFEKSSALSFNIFQTYGGMDNYFPANVRDELGNIYAIPNGSQEDEYTLTWIRKDWLDKLGLKEPKTIAELEATAKAFVENKLGGEGTSGFILDKTMEDSNTSIGTPGLWFHNYGAYPNNWYIDEATGQHVYGSVQKEVKEALRHMAELYQQGLICKDFGQMSAEESVQNGSTGILFGTWSGSAAAMASSKAKDENAQWIPLWLNGDNGTFNTYKPDVETESVYWVMSAKCNRPDVLVRMANISAEQQNLYGVEAYDEYQKHIPRDVDMHYSDEGYKFDWQAWPISVKVRYYDQISRLQTLWTDLINQIENGQRIPAFAVESFNGRKIVDYAQGRDITPTGQYIYTKSLSLDLIARNKDSVAEKTIYVPKTTLTMEKAWTDLQELEQETFLKIITGEASIDSFDTFVKTWYAKGGRQITNEVNGIQSK